jgi:tocopherol cyclase
MLNVWHKLKLLKNPILFQGRGKSKGYFEGWYFKQVSDDLKTTISFIPGISMDEKDPHSFIQCIYVKDAEVIKTEYFRYGVHEFHSTDEPFTITIGENLFSNKEINLNLQQSEVSIKCTFKFSKFRPIKTNWLSPNIMGYYAYVPLMECYHGIVSMSHRVSGKLEIGNESLPFIAGRGYLEKDWGRSFPSEYAWIQSNHFGEDDVSLMCSLATIPFLGASFQGFICNVTHKNEEYRFATYNASRLELLSFTEEKIALKLSNKDYTMELEARMAVWAPLKAPQNGAMSLIIKEGLSGVVTIRLYSSRTGEAILTTESELCGIELVKKI